MAIYYSHITALQIWRSGRFLPQRMTHVPKQVFEREFRTCVPTPSDIQEARDLGLQGNNPIHVLVPDPNHRRAIKGLSCHSCSLDLPEGAFLRLGPGSYVASPEFLLMQLAGQLDIINLTRLAYEFCGSYAITPHTARGFIGRESIMSVDGLSRFAAESSGVSGQKMVRRVSRFVMNGSASPRETLLAMDLAMPRLFGASHLVRPELNGKIELDDQAKAMIGESFEGESLRGDFYWRSAKLDVEYDSDLEHSSPSKISRDARRRDAISSAGVEVIVLTNQQVKSESQLDAVLSYVAKRTKSRAPDDDRDFVERRRAFRCKLLGMRDLLP